MKGRHFLLHLLRHVFVREPRISGERRRFSAFWSLFFFLKSSLNRRRRRIFCSNRTGSPVTFKVTSNSRLSTTTNPDTYCRWDQHKLGPVCGGASEGERRSCRRVIAVDLWETEKAPHKFLHVVYWRGGKKAFLVQKKTAA